MKNLTKEQIEQAFKLLKEIERKEIEQKMIVIRVYYWSWIVFLVVLVICIAFRYK